MKRQIRVSVPGQVFFLVIMELNIIALGVKGCGLSNLVKCFWHSALNGYAVTKPANKRAPLENAT